MNKKAFSPYIRTAMLSTIRAPFVISERVIYDYEIIMVSGGRCKITIDGIPCICKKNDVVFIRPNIPHKFECIENADFIQPHIHFDVLYTDKSDETPVSFKSKKIMSDYELSLIQEDVFEDVDIPYVFTPYDLEKFRHLFFEIITIYQQKTYNYELLYKGKMLELIDFILTQFESNKTEKNKSLCGSVVAVKDYIDNNYLSIISLESLSEQFYMNKYTLMRKFKLMYKQNIISYYRNMRIEYAKNILMATNLSIKDIAIKLNFSDVYSFSRFFKNYVDCSPSNYRKKIKLGSRLNEKTLQKNEVV